MSELDDRTARYWTRIRLIICRTPDYFMCTGLKFFVYLPTFDLFLIIDIFNLYGAQILVHDLTPRRLPQAIFHNRLILLQAAQLSDLLNIYYFIHPPPDTVLFSLSLILYFYPPWTALPCCYEISLSRCSKICIISLGWRLSRVEKVGKEFRLFESWNFNYLSSLLQVIIIEINLQLST